MAAVIQDSKLATEKLVSFQNSGVEVLAINGAGAILDKNGLNRVIFNPVAKTIVDGAPTALFKVPIAQGAAVGGVIDFFVYVSDGTDFQVISGIATYASVNKAGTLTSTVTYATANEAKAVSAGTITLAFTAAETDPDTLFIRVQPTGSLTETAYTIEYNVRPLRGAVTIL